MIKSIFFRALTLLGLTFVLIGCGAADPGEGGTGTPGTGPVTQADLEKIEGSIKDMIENAKGSINTSNGHAVAMKAISILKASQPNGSCSFFGVDGFQGMKDANTVTTKATETTIYTSHKGDGKKDFGGSGEFEIKVTTDAGVAAAAAVAGKLAANALITYTYKKFSIDGKYAIDGTLVMKQNAEASTVDAVKLGIQGTKTLKLFENETEIATIVFDIPADYEITNANCVKVPAAAELAHNEILAAKTKVIVKASAGATFADIEMSVSAIAVTKVNRTKGQNLDMLWALLGPKNHVNRIITA